MSEYPERIYARYSEIRPHVTVPRSKDNLLVGRERVFRKVLLPLLPADKQARILDLGCGYGEFLCFLQKEGYQNAAGIDLNRRQLDAAERLGVRNLRYGDARDALLESSNTLDCISAIDVLEHIPKGQILSFLDTVYGALRTGGRFICQVPNLAAFYTPLFYMDFSHESPFTATSLTQVLELANFTNVRVYPRGPVATSVRSAVRCVLWKLISSGLRFIQTVEGGPHHPSDSIYTAAILAVADKG